MLLPSAVVRSDLGARPAGASPPPVWPMWSSATWLTRLARGALGLTPTHDQLASAVLGLPAKLARARVNRSAAAALAHDVRVLAPHPPDALHRSRRPPPAAHPPPPPAEVRASSIPGAGAGLFATRVIRPGELVALYAGEYTPPAPAFASANAADGGSDVVAPAREFPSGGAYVIHLESGGYIDGTAHAERAKAIAAAATTPNLDAPAPAPAPAALWSVAALANHPPRGRLPNVVAVEVPWEDAEPPEEASSAEASKSDAAAGVPRSRVSDASSVEATARATVNPVPLRRAWVLDLATGEAAVVPPEVPTRGLAYVASREVRPGEEIFFNYGLARRDAPRWYAPVPAAAVWAVVDEADDEMGAKENEEKRAAGAEDGTRWGSGAMQ